MQNILLTDSSRLVSEHSCYQEIKNIRQKNGGHTETYNRLMKNILDDDERINKKFGNQKLSLNRQEKANQSARFSVMGKKSIIKVDRGQNTKEQDFGHSKQNNGSQLYVNPKQVQVSQVDYSSVLKEPLMRSTQFSSLPKHVIIPIESKLVQKTQYAYPQIIIPPKEVIVQQQFYQVPIQRVTNIVSNKEFHHLNYHSRNKSEIGIRKSNWIEISAEKNNEQKQNFENKNESLLFGITNSYLQKSSNVILKPKQDSRYFKIQKQIQQNIKKQENSLSNVQNYQQFLLKKQESFDSGFNKLNEQRSKPYDRFSHTRHVSDTFAKTKFDLSDPINSQILKKIKMQMGYGQTVRNQNQNQSQSFVHQKSASLDNMYRFLVPRSNLFKKSLERIPQNSEQSSMKQMSSQAQVRESQGSGYQEDNRFKKSIKESIFAQQSAQNMNKKSSRIRSEANLDESIANGLDTLLELNLDNFPVSEGEQSESNLSCFSILR